jgi:hypothetical protein
MIPLIDAVSKFSINSSNETKSLPLGVKYIIPSKPVTPELPLACKSCKYTKICTNHNPTEICGELRTDWCRKPKGIPLYTETTGLSSSSMTYKSIRNIELDRTENHVTFNINDSQKRICSYANDTEFGIYGCCCVLPKNNVDIPIKSYEHIIGMCDQGGYTKEKLIVNFTMNIGFMTSTVDFEYHLILDWYDSKTMYGELYRNNKLISRSKPASLANY